ncbi:class E sortase [Streptacidiphilus fuscans]|uniref:Class E sortase n=1 Tax=Streptacidiphilus fuscans TaxID=2789292 RepID=A0A931BFA4_9ACTN|nr:class E sortase [Streptacidiphilus fuscans]MBF9072405.1 class E sortase [Streptacidiphilus fuscans]
MGPRWLWGLRRGLILFGELAVTFGLVLVLLATYELWWTNHTADANAAQTVAQLEQQWDAEANAQASAAPSGVASGSASPSPSGTASASPRGGAALAGGATGGSGSGGWVSSGYGINSMVRDLPAFAVIRIPVLGLVFPVAEGVDKYAVLNHGYIGHYPGTAMPGQPGNFAVAGHRNTHGQPFRYLDQVHVGDVVIVEVQGWDYVYRIDSVLPQTEASDGTVILPEPYSSVHPSAQYGYRTPGHYITLTTCTPAFTSLYRMVLWGHLVGQQPRPATVGG